MQLQPELCEPLAEIGVEPLRFIEVLETHDETEHQALARAMARALRAAIASRLETLGLEQYKIYVEMADRISARRGMTNTYFLTLNTAIFTGVGVFWQHPPTGSPVLLTVPCVVLLIQCFAWFWLLRSYRQLNTAKYAVIGAFEERLPASPYWNAEWAALGHGHDPARYWPLS